MIKASLLTYDQLQDVVYHELVRLINFKMPLDMFKSTAGLMPRMLETLLAQYFLTHERFPSLDDLAHDVVSQYLHLNKTGYVNVIQET